MGSKAISFVGFFLTVFLLVTVQTAAARELTQVSGALGKELTDTSSVVHATKKATDQYEPPRAPGYGPITCNPYGCTRHLLATNG